MKNIIIIFLLIFIVGCDPHDGKLTIVNNSEDTIFYGFSYDNDGMSSYPVTKRNGKDIYEESDMVLPNSENHQYVMDKWEDFINESCKDSTLIIFFFRKELIKTASKDSIIKNQLFSKKEKLKVRDLKKLNWRVPYP